MHAWCWRLKHVLHAWHAYRLLLERQQRELVERAADLVRRGALKQLRLSRTLKPVCSLSVRDVNSGV